MVGVKMAKHTITINDETNLKLKYVKGLHGLDNVSQAIEQMAQLVKIPLK